MWTKFRGFPRLFPSIRKPPVQKPSFHRGHRHRNLRLPASAYMPESVSPTVPSAGGKSRQQTVDQMVDQVTGTAGGDPHPGDGARSAAAQGRAYQKELDAARRSRLCTSPGGRQYVRADRGNQSWRRTKSTPSRSWWTGWSVKPEIRSRLADSIETALRHDRRAGPGRCHGRRRRCSFAQNYACPDHDISIEELSPNMFSFNNPAGSCPTCTGLGVFHEGRSGRWWCRYPDRSIRDGAFKVTRLELRPRLHWGDVLYTD